MTAKYLASVLMDTLAKMAIVQYILLSTHFARNLINVFTTMLIFPIYSDFSVFLHAI
jgi:hypothetical protein